MLLKMCSLLVMGSSSSISGFLFLLYFLGCFLHYIKKLINVSNLSVRPLR